MKKLTKLTVVSEIIRKIEEMHNENSELMEGNEILHIPQEPNLVKLMDTYNEVRSLNKFLKDMVSPVHEPVISEEIAALARATPREVELAKFRTYIDGLTDEPTSLSPGWANYVVDVWGKLFEGVDGLAIPWTQHGSVAERGYYFRFGWSSKKYHMEIDIMSYGQWKALFVEVDGHKISEAFAVKIGDPSDRVLQLLKMVSDDVNEEKEEKEMNSQAGITYIACPYSHPAPWIREARARTVTKYALECMSRGGTVFSPITHGHALATNMLTDKESTVDVGWERWAELDRGVISICNSMIVLKLPGWEESAGVQAEIKLAEELKITIRYVDFDPETLAAGLNLATR